MISPISPSSFFVGMMIETSELRDDVDDEEESLSGMLDDTG